MIINKSRFFLVAVEGAILFLLIFWVLIQQTTNLVIFYSIFAPQKVYLSLYFSLVLISAIFFGLNLAIFIETWKIFKTNKLKKIGDLSLSAVISFLGAACPVCGAFILSFVGLSSFVTLLPFRGLEFLGLSAILLAATFFLSLKKIYKNPACLDCQLTNNNYFSKNYLIIHLSVWLVFVAAIYFLLQKELL